jgi:hypothetical protein
MSFFAPPTWATQCCRTNRRAPHRNKQPRYTFAAATGPRWWFCFVDGQPIEAVVPAPLVVNLDALLELTGGNVIRLARADELARLYPG